MSNQASATQLLPTTPKGSVGNPRTIAMRWPETDTEPVNHPATSASGPIRPPASISSRPHRARHPPKNIL
ncbi:hypothetical protein HRG_013296 [Hirsutella rhossiliensis]